VLNFLQKQDRETIIIHLKIEDEDLMVCLQRKIITDEQGNQQDIVKTN